MGFIEVAISPKTLIPVLIITGSFDCHRLVCGRWYSTDVGTGPMWVGKVVRPSRPYPPYPEMVCQAISALHDSSGLSKAVVYRYIVEHSLLGNHDNVINSNVRLALMKGVC